MYLIKSIDFTSFKDRLRELIIEITLCPNIREQNIDGKVTEVERKTCGAVDMYELERKYTDEGCCHVLGEFSRDDGETGRQESGITYAFDDSHDERKGNELVGRRDSIQTPADNN